ncbi:MAG: hypothetical protein D3903_07250 [Candidatus Electrothrix sp. GM3_4]|nr:hypothetical protein [Candidatus Electrothrix sp. GM3_4]
MKRDKKNILKGIFYGFFGTVICAMLLGTRKPDMEVKTGVNVDTGESVLLLSSQQSQKMSVPPVIGRYQISSWGCSQGAGEGGGYGAFLTDTTTGKTKIVYSYIPTRNGKGIRINNLNKRFDNISQ